MRVMLNEMERHYGKRPIIYTTVDFYQAILADGAFMDYPIWVRSTKYHPSVKYGPRPWAFWQYQSDAHVDGIGVKVDRNAFSGTREQWEAFLRDAEKGGGRPGAPQVFTQQLTASQTPAPEPAAVQPVAAQPVAAEPETVQPGAKEPAEQQQAAAEPAGRQQ